MYLIWNINTSVNKYGFNYNYLIPLLEVEASDDAFLKVVDLVETLSWDLF